MKNRFVKYCLFCCYLLSGQLLAQTTLQVVSKNVDKEIAYKKGYSLVISGEKAAIKVDTWQESKIKIQLELVAKHPELKIAKKDLETFKYVTERIGKKIYLRNYIALAKGDEKPSSNLKASFKIMVPEQCEVILNNSFGTASINDLKGKLAINSQFCEIDLKHLKGEIEINSKFGDISGTDLGGLVSIQSKRSNITLDELKGDYNIRSQYGVVRINADHNLINLNIKSEKTDIHFYNRELGKYQYALITDYGEIKVPEYLNMEIDQIAEHTKKASSKESKESNINIHTSFGNITIENKQ